MMYLSRNVVLKLLLFPARKISLDPEEILRYLNGCGRLSSLLKCGVSYIHFIVPRLLEF